MESGDIRQNLKRIIDEIGRACLDVGRDPSEVTLIAVTKTFGTGHVRAAIDAGATDIGENYVQEARTKIEEVGRDRARWHFIGGLQANKAKYVVRLFDLIHSVDSEGLAVEIARRAEQQNRVMDILVQVDISREEQKSGVMEENLVALLEKIAPLKGLRIRGLMGMPPFGREPEASRPYFRRMKELLGEVNARKIPGAKLTELSMGMSDDFAIAVQEGATMVRVGTAIFGHRA